MMGRETLRDKAAKVLAEPCLLAALPNFWSGLEIPEFVVMPESWRVSSLANIGQPVMIGEVPVHTQKVSGKWFVCGYDVRAAAREAVELRALSRSKRHVLRGKAAAWERLLIADLEEAYGEVVAGAARSGAVRPEELRRFPTDHWGCLDVSQIADRQGRTWTVPESWTGVLAAIAARYDAESESRTRRLNRFWDERSRCADCRAVLDPFGDRWVTKDGVRVALCPACLNGLTAGLRVYADQMRDIQYSRGRTNLKANPAGLYRCAVCAVPADYWDHCHDHGYVRGPLCRDCNSNDNWAFRNYRRPEAFCPMEHVRRCKGCAAAGPGLKVRARVVQRALGYAIADHRTDHDSDHIGRATVPVFEVLTQALKAQSFDGIAVRGFCIRCGDLGEVGVIDPQAVRDADAQVHAYLLSGDDSVLETACTRPAMRDL